MRRSRDPDFGVRRPSFCCELKAHTSIFSLFSPSHFALLCVCESSKCNSYARILAVFSQLTRDVENNKQNEKRSATESPSSSFSFSLSGRRSVRNEWEKNWKRERDVSRCVEWNEKIGLTRRRETWSCAKIDTTISSRCVKSTKRLRSGMKISDVFTSRP